MFRKYAIVFLVCFLALVSSCRNSYLTEEKDTVSPRSVFISWGESTRTIYPSGVPSPVTYDLLCTADGCTDVIKKGLKSSSDRLELSPAVWTVTVTGNDSDGNPVASGSASVDTNTKKTVNVYVKYIYSGEGAGNIDLLIDCSHSYYNKVDTVFVKITDPSGMESIRELPLTNKTADLELENTPVGNYLLYFTFISGTYKATTTESVLVAKEQTTSSTIYPSGFYNAPANVAGVHTSFSDGAISVNWQAPSDTSKIDGIILKRKKESEPDSAYTVLGSLLPVATTTYTDNNIEEGNAYHYMVCTVNSVNIDNPSGERVTGYCPERISTIAGNGVCENNGDGGLAVNASVIPRTIVTDGNGNIFFSSGLYIRKISYSGIIETIAGNGNNTYTPDGTVAVESSIWPYYLAVDSFGCLYFYDLSCYSIRKIDKDGTIKTITGNGDDTNSGDGGPALAASVSFGPIAVDGNGNVFVASGGLIRKITTDGTIVHFGGTGDTSTAINRNNLEDYIGLNAKELSCGWLDSLSADSAGNISFYLQTVIVKINPEGIIESLTDTNKYMDQLVVSPTGEIFFKDNTIIYKSIGSDTYPVAGNGANSYNGDYGYATEASLSVNSFTVDHEGVLYISDEENYRIRRVGPAINATSLVFVQDSVELSTHSSPHQLEVSRLPANATSGIIWSSSDSSVVQVSDSGVITAVATGIATITASSGSALSTCSVTVSESVASPVINPVGGEMSGPVEVSITCLTQGASIRYTIDGSDPDEITGILYENPFTLTLTTLVKAKAFKDGLESSPIVSEPYTVPVTYRFDRCVTSSATQPFYSVYGITLDSSGMIYVPDLDYDKVYVFTEDGSLHAVWGESGGTDGKLFQEYGIVMVDNSIYVGDIGKRIQKFTGDGVFISKFGTSDDFGSKGVKALTADSSGRIYAFDGSQITRWSSNGIKDESFLIEDSTRIGYLFTPDQGIAVDSQGNVYVASVKGEGLILKYDSYGQYVSTIDQGYGWVPHGMAIDEFDNLYVAISVTSTGGVVRVYDKNGTQISTIGSGYDGSADGDVSDPAGVAVSPDGSTVWVVDSDTSNKRITKFIRN